MTIDVSHVARPPRIAMDIRGRHSQFYAGCLALGARQWGTARFARNSRRSDTLRSM